VGNRVLEDFRTLFSRLRDRATEVQVGGATNELALLAGVFGLGALSGTAFAQMQTLFPMGTRNRSSTWLGSCGSACGSSWGSSSGSSCGSSCGGGGCGGGCGGCGS
jgi:hypothetical protein